MSDVISPDALKMEAGALMPAILTQSVHENLLSAPGSPIADLSSDIQVAYFYPSSRMFGANLNSFCPNTCATPSNRLCRLNIGDF